MTTVNLQPAKVAPIGARRPLMQDENSGKRTAGAVVDDFGSLVPVGEMQ